MVNSLYGGKWVISVEGFKVGKRRLKFFKLLRPIGSVSERNLGNVTDVIINDYINNHIDAHKVDNTSNISLE